ncbi:MAG: methyltransferase domain-containing protein [Dehalococcoidia bacterium]|jgi:SAM-dependent methyltransferase
MLIKEYDTLIAQVMESSPSHIELNREKEIKYVQGHKYHFLNIINSLPEKESLKLLDIGITPNTFLIKCLYPTYEVSAVDLTNLMEEGCNKFGIRLDIVDLSSQIMSFDDNYFDVVIFTEVLEHIFAPPSKVLSEVRRVMKSGGLLIFSVPNIATLLNRVRFLFGVTPLPPADDQMKDGWVHGHDHIHEYTMREVDVLFKDCKFRVVHKSYFGFVVGSKYPRILAFLYNIICNFVPSFKGIIFLKCIK